jgi:pimeloyl-ACP methyl ester carboxylesterase
VGFAWYPREDLSRPARGTVVVAPGGPGIATTPAEDAELLAALRRDRNLLFMDYRGTGRSGYLACEGLDVEGTASPPGAIRACAERLGRDADLYTTADAAEDLEDVRAALDVDTLDLLGFSYGTFFGQVYALTHPERVRTLTLYGTLPLDADPWDRRAARWPSQAMRDTCAGSRGCRGDGDPARDWARLVDQVRQAGEGGEGGVRIEDLVTLHQNFPSLGAGRDLVPATRAFLRGDPAPLRRLVEQSDPDLTPEQIEELESALPAIEPTFISGALNLAVLCADVDQPFDRTADPDTRRAQLEAARAALPARSFAPFTIAEWPVDASVTRPQQCVDWAVTQPAAPVVAPGTPYPDVPTLVINGAVDARTPPDQARRVAKRFPDSAFVAVPFADHSPAPQDRCALDLVARFIAAGRTGEVAPGGCASTAFRTAGPFARSLADVDPAPARDRRAGRRDRQVVTAAVATAADALARVDLVVGDSQQGLRGGTLTFDRGPGQVRVDLDGARWVADLAVNGSVTRDLESGEVIADLTVRADGGRAGTVTARWDADEADPVATTGADLGGPPLSLSVPAT